MSYNTITYEVTGDKVALVTINRPEALNAFTQEMCKEFEHVWAAIMADDNVNSVVLRAAPGRAFSTGADVKQNDPNVANHWYEKDPGESLGPRSNRMWKPVVCAVHGLCCGGAFYWLNECDIIICSEDAQFFDPHVSYGMVSAAEPIGMSYRLPLQEVMRIILLGNDERVSAATALRIGLVSEVVSEDKLRDRAYELAAKIANKPPAAVQGSVRAVWESLDLPRQSAINLGLRHCKIGNALGAEQMDVAAARKQSKTYEIR
jgi:enoyl-CoA hydratase/carnithine racemase